MDLTVTKSALQIFKALSIPTGFGIRLDAKLTGGCSSTVYFELEIDETRKKDTVIEIEELFFYIDFFTSRIVKGPLTLSYDEAQGFKLMSDEETLSYGMKLSPLSHKKEQPSSYC